VVSIIYGAVLFSYSTKAMFGRVFLFFRSTVYTFE